MFKKFLISFVAVVCCVAISAPAAVANPGPSGYWKKTCSVATGAKLQVSNYYSGTGQKYHVDLNSGSGWYPVAIYFNGTRLGGWNEQYVYREIETSINTVKGQWRYGSTQYYSTCTISG